ncbi:hypothetical protein GCM10027256_33940 [Novispirillum itersonii subsp. nipponicum]|uniref:Uncharacterized protein n=1 Tax=Novispirillum itersonii TaxID=189 RepID=A0A7X0DLP7_NOVIT|nr:hypothetical protein [Novispirillum itersonii]
MLTPSSPPPVLPPPPPSLAPKSRPRPPGGRPPAPPRVRLPSAALLRRLGLPPELLLPGLMRQAARQARQRPPKG